MLKVLVVVIIILIFKMVINLTEIHSSFLLLSSYRFLEQDYAVSKFLPDMKLDMPLLLEFDYSVVTSPVFC